MKTNRITCLFFALSLTCTSAFAEKASKESITALMDKIGTKEMGSLMIKQIMPALRQMIPNATEEFWGGIAANLNADDITELMIPIYQKHLNADDVKQLNAFYSSPIGKKFIEVRPAIIQESMTAGKEWGQKTAMNVLESYKKQEANQKKFVK